MIFGYIILSIFVFLVILHIYPHIRRAGKGSNKNGITSDLVDRFNNISPYPFCDTKLPKTNIRNPFYLPGIRLKQLLYIIIIILILLGVSIEILLIAYLIIKHIIIPINLNGD
tara:strand:+ start:803 stop:1141 length:339 start_codon:yes stop_codon:yes gene_type:complete